MKKVESTIEAYLCLVVYEDLTIVELVRIEEKIKMIRRLNNVTATYQR